jgi:fumarate reductase flavoprotein subunit
VAESTVFGGIAGDVMAAFVDGRRHPNLSAARLDDTARRLRAPLGRTSRRDLYDLQRRLRETMWDQVGLVRDEAGLRRALVEIEATEEALGWVGVAGGPAFNTAWQDWLNLTSQLTTARLIAESALARRESRGAHYRRDCPERTPGPPYVVYVRQTDAGPIVWEATVAFTRTAPEAPTPASMAVQIGD